MTPEETQQVAKEAREAYDAAVIAANVALREAQQKHQRDLQTAQDAFREKMRALQGNTGGVTPNGESNRTKEI